MTGNLLRRLNWDKIGIGLSSICVVHCILTPIAFVVLPAIGFAAGEHTHEFHWIMGGVLLPVALIAFVRGFKHHRQFLPALIGTIGVAIIFAALFFVDSHDDLFQHFAISMLGSAFLLVGHVLNRRACNQCAVHNHDHAPIANDHAHASEHKHDHSHSHDHSHGHAHDHSHSHADCAAEPVERANQA